VLRDRGLAVELPHPIPEAGVLGLPDRAEGFRHGWTVTHRSGPSRAVFLETIESGMLGNGLQGREEVVGHEHRLQGLLGG